MKRALAAVGPADPALAWERFADLTAWPEWSPQIRAVSSAEMRLRPGLTGVVHGWGGLEVPFTVESVDEAARRWVWSVRPTRAGVALPGLLQHLGTMRLEHEVAPSGRGTLTTLIVTGAPPVVLAYAPVAEWALRRLVR